MTSPSCKYLKLTGQVISYTRWSTWSKKFTFPGLKIRSNAQNVSTYREENAFCKFKPWYQTYPNLNLTLTINRATSLSSQLFVPLVLFDVAGIDFWAYRLLRCQQKHFSTIFWSKQAQACMIAEFSKTELRVRFETWREPLYQTYCHKVSQKHTKISITVFTSAARTPGLALSFSVAYRTARRKIRRRT
jgi:hypothetical protein